MREQLLRSAQMLTNPLIAGILATFIVILAGAFAASRIARPMYDMPVTATVEKVSVAGRAMPAPQPKLEIRAAAQSESVASAGSPALSAPQIARTAKVSLYVSNVDKVAASLARTAKQNDGDVFSSDISNADGSNAQPSGEMEIRVPADRFGSTMAAVMQTGTVRERSTGAEDLTGSITDTDARLRNLRRTEADIRSIMDRSGSVSQIMDAENQLSQVREQIETLESELKDMRLRVAYATIDVDMQAEATTAPVTPTASSQLVSSWHNAVASLGAVTVSLIAAILWFVVFIPYLIAIAAIGWLVYVQARRRTAA